MEPLAEQYFRTSSRVQIYNTDVKRAVYGGVQYALCQGINGPFGMAFCITEVCCRYGAAYYAIVSL